MTDVCLIVEGTYPYVSGGVSTWTHRLISRLSSLTFSIVHIGAKKQGAISPKYKLPKNVVSFHDIYLFDDLKILSANAFIPDRKLSDEKLAALKFLLSKLHEEPMQDRYYPLTQEENVALKKAVRTLSEKHSDSTFLRSLSSREIWNEILELYFQKGDDLSFIDFFYSWRSVHLPLFKILSAHYPKARIYHALCTGYAGIGALKASCQHERPLILTEHGIYAHERAIEIAQADWNDSSPEFTIFDDRSDPFRHLWITVFRNMSRLAYARATTVTTLYEGNRLRQLRDGCHPGISCVIPNGITKKFEGLRKKRAPWEGLGTFVIGFVGRVVSIKDIRTLIKAVRLVVDEMADAVPGIVCKIIGPADEEKDYLSECKELVKFLNLNNTIEFVEEMPGLEIYEKIDCLVLSSISEAQPLVVLEAGIAGVPVVSTDVGSCVELLNGKSPEDQLIGISGLLSPIGDAQALADNLVAVIRKPDLWKKMSDAGMVRGKRYYDENEIFEKYDKLYKSCLTSP